MITRVLAVPPCNHINYQIPELCYYSYALPIGAYVKATFVAEYGPFLLKLLVTVKIMYTFFFFKCAVNVVKAVQVNITNAYMKLQSMN